MCKRLLFLAALLAAVLSIPRHVHGQGAVQASFAGIVRDSSGGVVPGVTVEASSPVLIEKSRSAVTDDTGRYRIVGLTQGTYTLTFTLQGFNTVRREGIELSGSLTAAIDVEMRVGALEETVTVKGESPIVDVQSSKQQRVIGSETFNSIPGSRNYQNLVVLVPGLNSTGQNVGGINGPAPLNVGGHGGAASEGRFNVDGLGVNGSSGGGTLYVTDTANAAEVTIDVTGGLGEAEAGGPVINVVPKTGGNRFSGSGFGAGANGSLQGSNFDDGLLAAGLREPGKLKDLYELNGAIGGPIIKDKFWFFLTGRYQETNRYVAGMYYNKNAGNPNAWTYDPDFSRQAISDGQWNGTTLRTTWQISSRQKLNLFWDEQDMCRNCTGGGSATTSPEAQDGSQNINWIHAYQAAYSAPFTSKLLFEAGFGAVNPSYGNPKEGFDRSIVRTVEQAAPIPNLAYRSMFWDQVRSFTPRYRAALSYVTGAQNMKVGFETYHNVSTRNYQRGDGLQYRFSSGAPNQLTMLLNDFTERARVRNLGIFAQNRWTIDRVTLEGGIRYENARSNSPEQVIGPSRFVPTAIVFPAQDIVKGYNDITLRGGAAIDLTGDGKTSLKINAGQYTDPAQWAGIFIEPNPARTRFGGGVPPQTTRAWTDFNRDFVPDCDLLNPLLNAECGPTANQNFGRLSTPSATYDPAVLEGWGVRPANWQFGVSLQRQVVARVSVEAGYHRRNFDSFLNTDPITSTSTLTTTFTATDNRAVTPADYNPYSVPVPVDPRLPRPGGYVISDLFNISPTAFGKTDNFISRATNYGSPSNYWHGVDVQVNARLSGGLTVQGGTSTGRVVNDTCELAIDNPSQYDCHKAYPFKTELRGLAIYTIPKINVQLSGTLQSHPGVEITALWNVPASVIAQSLGRVPSGGAANVQTNILTAGELYGARVNQVDMRVAKLLKFGRARANVGVDVYNLLNSNVPLTYVTTYGATWGNPNSVLDARFAKVSVQFDF
ncbi:MAG: TonB-dependent receptor [Acidobacteriota bacterium]